MVDNVNEPYEYIAALDAMVAEMTATPTSSPVPQGTPALHALVEKWRKQEQFHQDFRHSLSEPYGDLGHEHDVKAGVLRKCADELAAALTAPVGEIPEGK